MRELSAAALGVCDAVEAGDAPAFVRAAVASERALSALGQDADAPIVPLYARDLARIAEEEGAAFCPSGAGGGDIFVRFAIAPASARFTTAARTSRLGLVKLGPDAHGVRLEGRIGSPPS
jgi:hypothetical protein